MEDSEYEFYSLPTTSFHTLVRLYKSHTGKEFVPTAPSWPAELEEEEHIEGGKEVTEGTTIDTDEPAEDPDLDATNSGGVNNSTGTGVTAATKSGGTKTGPQRRVVPLPAPLKTATAAEALAKKTAAEALAKKNAARASRNTAIAKQTAAQLAAEEEEAQRKAEEEAEDAEQDDDDGDYEDGQQDEDDDDEDDDEQLAPAAKKKRTNSGPKTVASKTGDNTSTPKSSRKRATTEQSFDIETTQLLKGLQEQFAAIDLLATQHVVRPIKDIEGLADYVARGAHCAVCVNNNVARPSRPSSVCVGCSCVINHTAFLVCAEHATKHAFDKAKEVIFKHTHQEIRRVELRKKIVAGAAAASSKKIGIIILKVV